MILMTDNYDNDLGYTPEDTPENGYNNTPETPSAQPVQAEPVMGSFSAPEQPEQNDTDVSSADDAQQNGFSNSYDPAPQNEEPQQPFMGNPYQEPRAPYTPPYQPQNHAPYGAPQQTS